MQSNRGRSRAANHLCAGAVPILCVFLLAGCESSSTRPQPREGVQIPETPTEQTAAEARKKVLLVHSYHAQYEWVAQITRGVKRAFEFASVDCEVFHMDTKRRSDLEWKRQAGEAAAEVVLQWKPDVVIAVDDNAQEYFAKRYAGQNDPQIIFCGVNADPAKYGYPAANVTGILERPYYAATIDILLEILPEARRLAVITDNSPTSAGAIEYMRQHQQTSMTPVCWETPNTFEEWKASILKVQDSADAIATYMYHTVGQPDASQNMEPRDVMRWTVENSRIPLIGFFVFAVDDGALCGMVESGVEHGSEAGRLALQILNGTKPSDLPITTARHGQSMLNLDTAKRLGIEIPASVVANTDVVFGSTTTASK